MMEGELIVRPLLKGVEDLVADGSVLGYGGSHAGKGCGQGTAYVVFRVFELGGEAGLTRLRSGINPFHELLEPKDEETEHGNWGAEGLDHAQ